MTIKKINGSTFNVGGVKVTVSKDKLKVNGNALPAGEVFASFPKGVARKLRKLLASMGHSKLAAEKRAA